MKTSKNSSQWVFALVLMVSACDQKVSTPAPAPAPAPAASSAARATQARGFNNRTWYGKDTTKEIDSLLTRRNFLIVLDGSGSMALSQCSGNLTKIVAAKHAIAAFATKI